MKARNTRSPYVPDPADLESTTRGKLERQPSVSTPAADSHAFSRRGWDALDLGGALPGPGTVIAGRYRVEREIGSGGMGVVMAARHVELGHLVAIKFLSLRDEMATKRFMREARICAGLSSEHIVRVFDNGQLSDGTPYMVMEHLQGENLGEFMARARVSIAEAVDIVRQVCAALAEAHGAGIVHRDLKPSNLFRIRRSDGSALIKVLDFGISKIAEGALQETGAKLTRPGGFVGTQHYASPEQLISCHSVDQRADVWAIGTILYELLTGQLAFPQEHFMACWAAIAEGRFLPPRQLRPEISPALEAVVERCLQVDPDHRYTTSDELSQALEPHRAADAGRARFDAFSVGRGRPTAGASSRVGLQSTPHVPLPSGSMQPRGSAPDALRASQRRRGAMRSLSAVVLRALSIRRAAHTSPARGAITPIALGFALALAAIGLALGKTELRLPSFERVRASEPASVRASEPASVRASEPASTGVTHPAAAAPAASQKARQRGAAATSAPRVEAVPDTTRRDGSPAASPTQVADRSPRADDEPAAPTFDEVAAATSGETPSRPGAGEPSRPGASPARSARQATRYKAKGAAPSNATPAASSAAPVEQDLSDESRVDRELAQWVQALPQAESEAPPPASAQSPRDAAPALQPGARPSSPPNDAAYQPNGGFAPNPTYAPQVTYPSPQNSSDGPGVTYPSGPAYAPSRAYPPAVIYAPRVTPGYEVRAGYRSNHVERRRSAPPARPVATYRTRAAAYSGPAARPARAIRDSGRPRRSAPPRHPSQ